MDKNQAVKLYNAFGKSPIAVGILQYLGYPTRVGIITNESSQRYSQDGCESIAKLLREMAEALDE